MQPGTFLPHMLYICGIVRYYYLSTPPFAIPPCPRASCLMST